MTDKFSTQLNARISPDMFEKIKQLAERKNKSFSDTVRFMLEKAMSRKKPKRKTH